MSKELAKREETGIAQRQEGFGQLIRHGEGFDKRLVSQINKGVLKLDQHFYTTKIWDKATNSYKQEHRHNLDGKLFVGALAGCSHTTRILVREPDMVVAEATITYRMPNGEIQQFTREKEVCIALERLAAVTGRINSRLNVLKGKNATPEQRKRYAEINSKAMDIDDEDARFNFLRKELLDISDMQEVNDNMIKLRQTLVNMASSKALSSAYTQFLKYIGERTVYQGNPDGNTVEVTVINTVELPDIKTDNAINIMYDSTPESEAIETEFLLHNESSVDNEPITGVTVDAATGEIIEESGEPESEDEGQYGMEEEVQAIDEQAIKDGLLADINKLALDKKLTKSAALKLIHDATGKGSLRELESVDELQAVLDALRGM